VSLPGREEAIQGRRGSVTPVGTPKLLDGFVRGPRQLQRDMDLPSLQRRKVRIFLLLSHVSRENDRAEVIYPSRLVFYTSVSVEGDSRGSRVADDCDLLLAGLEANTRVRVRTCKVDNG